MALAQLTSKHRRVLQLIHPRNTFYGYSYGMDNGDAIPLSELVQAGLLVRHRVGAVSKYQCTSAGRIVKTLLNETGKSWRTR